MDITQLAQFGVAGLAVFLMYRIASNHIDHNTKAINKMTSVIENLNEWLRNHK